MKIYAIVILLQCLYIKIDAEWLQIDRSFTNKQITDHNNWKMYKDYGSTEGRTINTQTLTCSVSQFQYIEMQKEYQVILKEYNVFHFQVQVIYDYFAIQAISSDNELYVYYDRNSCKDLINYDKYNDYNINQNSNRICIGGSQKFRYYTNITYTNTTQNYDDKFNITFYYIPGAVEQRLGIRNLLVYINTCHTTCKSCNGKNSNNCASCYDSASLSSGSCTCKSDQQFAQTSIGCRQECERNYYIARSDKICVPDRRITSNLTYFNTNTLASNTPFYSPFIFIVDQLHLRTISELSYYSCNSTNYFGQFKYNEAIHLQLNFDQPVKFIRIRLTFHLSQMQQNSQIQLFFNDQIYSKLSKTSTTQYSFDNFIPIYQYDETCTGTYKKIRVETVINIPNSNPLLKIQGVFQQNTEVWGFNNFTIDQGVCKENCKICKDFNTCQECQSGFKLYKNGCVSTCPIHSSACVDYEDLIPYSRYVAKGFYDFNMTYDEIESFYDPISVSTGDNFKTGQKFSFFPDKLVLGGMLVWSAFTIKKNWNIIQPHYAVTFRFNITFGDNYPGSFYYKIDSQSYGPISKPTTGGQNIIGKSDDEFTLQQEKFQNFNGQNLLIELQCSSTVDYRDSFCAISDYFLVVHNCQPLCLSCTSSSDCISWKDNKSSCDEGKYLYYNTTSFNYTCESCTQVGCKTCTSAEICTQCIDNTFILQNDICQFQQNTVSQNNTVQSCNLYCLTCDGDSKYNCLSCNTNYHRKLSGNQCICESGYFEDSEQIECSTFLCGDQILQKGEQCDDGNFNPFDGCHQCKLSCNQYCDICMNGWCYKCQEGYELSSDNSCQPICHDNIIAVPEQCDNNQSNCLNCQFKCTDNCNKCEFGICKKCNEQEGYYLQQDGSCQSQCGDKIISHSELCDDNNSYPYDGCHQCILSCDEYCDICYQGLCTECKKGYQLDFKINQCLLKCDDGYYLDVYDNCDKFNIKCQQCKLKCKDPCTKCGQDGCLECNKPGWYFNSVNKNCEPQCGDGIIIEGLEECEDSLDNDCNECKYQCQEECNFCVQGRCFSCINGWNLNLDQICTVIHGDNLFNNLIEQCDDYNSLPNDGCYQGKFQCQSYCIKCMKSSCLQCELGYYLQDGFCEVIYNDGIQVFQEQCDDDNLIPEDGCNSGRFECPQNCLVCVYGQCLECIISSGYGYLDDQKNQCKPICGDHIQTGDEECEDGNFYIDDGCHQCKFQCDSDCALCDKGKCLSCKYGFTLNKKQNKCVSLCGDGIVTRVEQCDDGNMILNDECGDCQYQCNENCLNCVEGKCYKCQNIGWELNLISNDCQSICGDGLVVGNEQCDDQNEIQEDGCHECQYKCQEACTSCIQGYCQECNTLGWELLYNRCETICGDKLIIGLEECDDGNQVQEDGCYECKFQCQDQCTDCQKGVCMACDTKGWEIIDNLCYAKCGDGFVVEGIEECDDGNDIQFDGCFNCNYQCQELCTQCEKGICYECNVLGWIIENHQCQPFCGDGIIVGYEQCDDMNDDFNDGCHNCLNFCDQYCLDCQQGICVECELGRFVDQNVCHAQCGDGSFVKSVEECDDGNQDNGDGCNSNCKVEKDWACNNIEGSFSICQFSIQPDFTLNLITKEPEDFEEVQLTFNQKIKLSQQVTNDLDLYFNSSIENVDSSKYEIIISYSEQLTSEETKDLIINIRIIFFVPITSPVLKVEFTQNPLVSEYDLNLTKKQNTIQLLSPLVLSQTQKEVAQSVKKFNKVVIYSMVGVSSLCLLSGSSETFWNLMDQLQYLSYIKYINIKFPNNLNIYFDVFQLITISPAINFFGVGRFFEAIDGSNQYFLETKSKFQSDEINAYFFHNFHSFLFCISSAYIGYWATTCGYLFLYKLGKYDLSKLPEILVKTYFSLRKSLKQKADQFYLNGILRILLSNTYDVTFACAIQICTYPTQNDLILKINYVAAIIVYIVQFSGTLYIINILNNFSKANSLKSKQKYEALFDGLKSTKDIWKIQHNAIQMIKKQIFISLIVFMQNDGQIQSLCLGFVQTTFLIYLFLAQPLTNKFEYYKILVTEILIIFNTITFLLYANRVKLQLSLDNIINIGWLHVSTSTSILGVSLILDLYQQFQIMIKKIQKAFQKPKIERNDSIVYFI